jgi:hypothetical protein
VEFQFLRPRGCPAKPFRTLSLCFGVTGKTSGLIFRNNFVKEIFVCIGHRDNVLARCDSIFPLLRCQGVWKKRAHNFLFPKSSFRIRRTTVLGMFEDSAIILDAIRVNFWLNQQQQYLPQFESILDGHYTQVYYELPSVSKSRILPKNVWSVQSLIRLSVYANTNFSVADRPALKRTFMATLCLFPPSMTYKENGLCKTSYNSYTVKDKQTKLGVWTDVGW